ncbi:MAG: insulinase family protein [Phycisphaerae bacterium]|jgi:predicted Zn-dependent peptidase|nr:insulinase family protein [Phycisphaerae bacterium]
MKNIQHHTCANGLQIVTQHIPNVKTVALNWGVRAGSAIGDCDGESVLLTELIQRGIRNFTAKEHTDALDSLGVQKHVACGAEFIRISAVFLGNRLQDALPLLGGYFLSPTISENDLKACKNLCLHALMGLTDNPSHLASIALNSHHLPPPFNRSPYGTESCIRSTTIEQLRDVHKTAFIPNESILVLVGDLDSEWVVQQVSLLTENWDSSTPKTNTPSLQERGTHFIEQDSSQVHLAFAFDAPDASSANSILEAVAISIFGGTTSGRLFTQVRQRRSLCYSVSARYSPAKERSAVRMYAGTTPERAQETADVCLEQLAELTGGISEEEFIRTIVQMKARTVMHGESTAARASALWGDQYALGVTRTMQDRLQEIDDVELEAVNEWLSNRTIGEVTFVSVGPHPLTIAPESLVIGC